MPNMAARKNTTEVTDEPTTDEATTITVKDLCEALDADPKSFRRWLRTQTTDRAGRGGRWTFSPEVADQLKERYAKRSEAKATEPTLDEVTE